MLKNSLSAFQKAMLCAMLSLSI